jgi:hypothetical protein
MATKTDDKAGSIPSFYADESNLKKLCDFLRSNDGPPVREALLMEKRVLYLKGKTMTTYCHVAVWSKCDCRGCFFAIGF